MILIFSLLVGIIIIFIEKKLSNMERLDEVFLTSVSKKFLVSPNCSVVASFGIAFVSVNFASPWKFLSKA